MSVKLRPEQPYPAFPRAQLTWTERVAIYLAQSINRRGWVRKITGWWGNHFTARILFKVTGHRWVHHHPERLDEVGTWAPLLVVSNHRTFFDMFVAITSLRYLTRRRLGEPAVFPVRSKFFYDNPLGVGINLLFSGGCMWPPVFRDERKHSLNPVTIETMHILLTQEGTCFGFHPEGRRSKSEDPYLLEPAKRGVGDLVERAGDDVIVLPLFISGLSGDLRKEWSLRKKSAAQTHPLQFYWGTPRPVRSFQGDAVEIASEVHQLIQDLGREARLHETGSLPPKESE